MQVEYDVDIPRNQYGDGLNATVFWNFYESEHKTVKYTFDTVEEAKKLYKSAQNILSRNAMVDVRVTMRKNKVYFEKYNL